MKKIYHIATQADLAKAKQAGYYTVESLFTEGFIHCSTPQEVIPTANRRFKGKSDLFLLELDELKIEAPVKLENLSGGAILYPHIYGKLNCNAIQKVYAFNAQANGEFLFPDEKDLIQLHFAEAHFLHVIIGQFKDLKLQAEKAMTQVSEDELFYQANADSNSIALIVQHLCGNMLSRWTDFFTTDGEKENRNRDEEFVTHVASRAELMERWDLGWTVFMNTLYSIKEEDLLKIVYIRAEAHSVIKAINRQTSHYAYHVGQIVFLAKQFKSDAWQTLTIPRKKV